MKIFISKNEDFTLDLQKDFLKECELSPVLNKFEIVILKPEIVSTQKNVISILENVLVEGFSTAPVQRLEKICKFHVKNEISDIQLFFKTLQPKLSLESIMMNANKREYDQLDIEIQKMQNSTCSEGNDCYDLFQLNYQMILSILENNQVGIRKESQECINQCKLSKFSLDFDLGKCLKELNTLDVISDILKLNFQSQNSLKVKELLHPRRWLPMNVNHFLPNSLTKSKKELDLNVNWNYVNVLKDLYMVNCNLQNLVLEREWKINNDNAQCSKLLKTIEIGLNMEEREIKNTIEIHDYNEIHLLGSNEIQDTERLENSNQLLLEKKSSMDTKVLVDRFMIKRKRTNSNMFQEKECKQTKIHQTVSKDFSIQKPREVSLELLDLEIPKFDQEQAKKHKYIGNSKFFSRRELVKLLESKYCIELIERNLDMKIDDSSPGREDLIIDEKTCLVFHSLNDLIFPIQNNIIDSLLETQIGQQLLVLSLRYSNICVILSEIDLEKLEPRVLLSKIKIDPFTPPVRRSILSLYKFSRYLYSLLDVKLKIFFVRNYDQIAWWIRSIGDAQALNNQMLGTSSTCHNLHGWDSRSWIMDNESSAERFLSMFPVLNSFQAQILLSQNSLKEILNMTKSELLAKFKLWVPERNLLIFYSMTRKKLEL